MRTYLIILILTLLSATSISAYDYQVIKSERELYYVLKDNYHDSIIRSIHIDATNFANDSVYTLMPTLLYDNLACYTYANSAWSAKQIIINQNWSKILNKENDTIFIKNDAKLYDKWTAFEIDSNLFLKMQVIAHKKETFLGLEDSIKTYNITFEDKKGLKVSHILNDQAISVSKNYGFTRTTNFAQFTKESLKNEEKFQFYDIIGMTNPDLGFINFDEDEIYDYHIGDERQFLYESFEFPDSPQRSTHTKEYTKLICIERFDSLNYVRTKVKRSIIKFVFYYDTKMEEKSVKIDTLSDFYYNDTSYSAITPIEKLDFQNNNEHIYFYTMGVENGRQYKLYDWYINNIDSCWHQMWDIRPSKKFKDLGVISNADDNDFKNKYYYSLIYVKKGDFEWGSPLNITSVSNDAAITDANIYPNPAIDFIHFKVDENFDSKIKIYDLFSNMIFDEKVQVESNLISIPVNNLAKGVYFIQIGNQIQKFVKI